MLFHSKVQKDFCFLWTLSFVGFILKDFSSFLFDFPLLLLLVMVVPALSRLLSKLLLNISAIK